MQTKQRTDLPCGRRTMLAELGIAEDPARNGQFTDAQLGYGCRCARCTDTQWDVQRLKFWLAARMLAFGADEAVVDRRIGPLTVDVYWRRGDRQFAIEVRSGPLTQELARAHTDRLKSLGFDGVLWLCAPGFWVAQLPALGITDLAPAACEYQVVAGMLEIGSGGFAAPRRGPYALREFLCQWVAGDIAWGYRDEMTKGWATVTDWEQHTKTQAMMLARQRQELVNQRTALALSRRSVREKSKQLIRLTARLERTEEFAQTQADSLAEANRKLDDYHRRDNALRNTILRLHQTINHWQLITIFVMMLLATFIAAAMVVR
uniref:hypothetical protein n=1 Tax=Nocardia donostiensis TaxID=1538463 RepID=UPI001FE7F237|nr:hypothetical protein [Nocardia donostiensis]